MQKPISLRTSCVPDTICLLNTLLHLILTTALRNRLVFPPKTSSERPEAQGRAAGRWGQRHLARPPWPAAGNRAIMRVPSPEKSCSPTSESALTGRHTASPPRRWPGPRFCWQPNSYSIRTSTGTGPGFSVKSGI